MISKHLLAAAAVAAAVLCSASARAGVLFDNLGATPVFSVATSEVLGQSFSTRGAPVSTENVTVVLDAVGSVSPGDLVLALYDDAGDFPPVATQSPLDGGYPDASGSGFTGKLVTMTLHTPLAANTRYWVVLFGPGWLGWDGGSGLGPFVAPEWSWDQGTGSLFDGDIGGSFMMRVATPEPAAWTMIILGVGLVGAATRGRRQAARAAA